MLIFHGEDVVASRTAFITHKQTVSAKSESIVQLAGDTLTTEQVVAALQTISLLGETNQVFIEGFFARRPSNDKKAITEYLLQHEADTVFLWDGKDVSTSLKGFAPSIVKKFDLPKVIFQFIDSFSVDLYRQALTSSEAELILGLMARRLHDLILLHSGKLQVPTWQRAKLQALSRRWSLDQLYDLNRQLLEIDLAQKTSAAPYDLSVALELWLVKLNNKST